MGGVLALWLILSGGGAGARPVVAQADPAPTFIDVQPGDYFYAAVGYLAARGIISGYADGTFRPSTPATRGQLAKIVVLGEGWPPDTSGGPHFRDVPPGYVFYPAIETAVHHGILSGYADGTFRPGADVTRGQLSKIIVGARGWPLDTGGGPHFTDVPPGSPFYSYVETAAARGIVSGYADHTFRPGNDATRGQIAKIVYNALLSGATATATVPPPPSTTPTPTGTRTPPPTTATTGTPTATPVPPTATATATPTCVPTWQVVPNPAPNSSAELRGFAVVAANDVWAVGNYNTGAPTPRYQTLIEHWNGATWSLVPSPNVPTGGSWLNAVAAVAADDVWAGGSSTGGTLIAHWDGATWTLFPAPTPPSGPGSIAAFTVLAPDNIWAVGTAPNAGLLGSLVLHWDGTAWTIVPSPNSATGYSSLLGVAAVAPDDIWAVGGGQRTIIEHWDGTQWTIVPGAEDPTLETRLAAVTALAAGDVWAVGQTFDALDNGHTLIEHWDGTQWHVVPSPDAGDSFLFAVAAVTARDIWAVGWGTAPYGLIAHWDGQQWSLRPSANGDAGLYTVAVVHAADLWVAGVVSAGPLIEHYACP
jgi:hypothetical protein